MSHGRGIWELEVGEQTMQILGGGGGVAEQELRP